MASMTDGIYGVWIRDWNSSGSNQILGAVLFTVDGDRVTSLRVGAPNAPDWLYFSAKWVAIEADENVWEDVVRDPQRARGVAAGVAAGCWPRH